MAIYAGQESAGKIKDPLILNYTKQELSANREENLLNSPAPLMNGKIANYGRVQAYSSTFAVFSALLLEKRRY
ncbi:MAG: hypothetical protein LBG43_02580 [Treponema sp.]|nr:hypothetical protein [Treponema sp.]